MNDTEGLKEKYTLEEAKEEIDSMLRKYGETCRIDFRKKDAEIADSYLVRSMADRRRICAVIARTGITGRNKNELSAEWRVHNVSYRVGFMKSHSKDVSLDYERDPRGAVRLATWIFKKLHLE